MQASQHRDGGDSARLRGLAIVVLSWNALSDPLMWPGAIEVVGVFLDHTIQMVSMENERVVNVHIRRLRQRIEKDPAEPRHVVTVFGVGYKFVE